MAAAGPPDGASVEVATAIGTVRGVWRDGAAEFLGVPYAEPPWGGARLAAPIPRGRLAGVHDASSYGATAPQPGQGITIIPEPVIEGDDYLNVNVCTPDPGAAGLPVLFWIHGGGFVAGSSASPWYRGTSFARDGVVTVSVTYRLGIEGFAHLADAPANRGLLDCIEALRFVQANIDRFGGDPSRVTIAGQSAGGGMTTTLLTSPAAAGLFHGVVAMSGTAAFNTTSDEAAAVSAEVAALLGLRPTARELAGAELATLLDAQAKVTAARASRLASSGGALPFSPYVDGEIVPEPPFDAVAGGVGGPLPLLVGTTEQEFNLVTAAMGDVDGATMRRRLARLGVREGELEAYVAAHDHLSPTQLVGQAITDRVFRLSAARLADARRDAAAPSGDRPGATYAYEFRWRAPTGLGSAHCLDLPFAFDLLGADGVARVLGDDPPQALADEVHAALVDFVRDGDAGWPSNTTPGRPTRLFDLPSSLVDDPLSAERRAFGLDGAGAAPGSTGP